MWHLERLDLCRLCFTTVLYDYALKVLEPHAETTAPAPAHRVCCADKTAEGHSEVRSSPSTAEGWAER